MGVIGNRYIRDREKDILFFIISIIEINNRDKKSPIEGIIKEGRLER